MTTSVYNTSGGQIFIAQYPVEQVWVIKVPQNIPLKYEEWDDNVHIRIIGMRVYKEGFNSSDNWISEPFMNPYHKIMGHISLVAEPPPAWLHDKQKIERRFVIKHPHDKQPHISFQ